jgi:hypothetical protein
MAIGRNFAHVDRNHVQLGANQAVETAAACNAADTGARLRAPVAFVGGILLKPFEHGLKIDPIFVRIAVIAVSVDLNAILV